ncbi:MAG: hypothetical protein LH480_08065 [Rubrivivax sp.]|nr:hypothetical protein [Rubrivivax sp.]
MQSPVESPPAPPTPPTPQAARRKLVRGIFAAPAIMTVCSGSAFAASSSLRCLSNQVVNNPTTMPVTTALDSWLRVQLWSTGDGSKKSPYLYYVSGADLQTWKRPSTSVYLGSSQWQLFNINTNSSGVQVGAPSGAVRCSQYAAIRFDANGNVVGVGTGAAGSTALPGTCWTSFATTL